SWKVDQCVRHLCQLVDEDALRLRQLRLYFCGTERRLTMKRLLRAVALTFLVASFPSGAAGDSSLRRPRPGSLFDGKSLAGWEGKLDLWTIENGELVGRMRNLDRCEFLRHTKVLADFRLIVEVKLVNDQGDSGITLRSDVTRYGDRLGY